MSNSYRDLVAWQVAVELVTAIYRQTETFPKHEIYTITSQIRRSAVSVPSNIAEGQGRSSSGEFQQFLGHAKGSLLELETQLIIANNLGYISQEQLHQLLQLSDRVSRLLNGLIQSLKHPSKPFIAKRNQGPKLFRKGSSNNE